MSGEEEVTETLKRTIKFIRGSQRNRGSSESETRHQSRMKWQLSEEQRKKADSRLLSYLQLVWGIKYTAKQHPWTGSSDRGKFTSVHQHVASTAKTNANVQVIEVDLTTTEDKEDEPETCTIEPPRRSKHSTRECQELPQQPRGDTLDNLSKLFDKNLLAELTSENTWMDWLRRVVERGDKQGFELMGSNNNPLWTQIAVQDDCILVYNRLAVPV